MSTMAALTCCCALVASLAQPMLAGEAPNAWPPTPTGVLPSRSSELVLRNVLMSSINDWLKPNSASTGPPSFRVRSCVCRVHLPNPRRGQTANPTGYRGCCEPTSADPPPGPDPPPRRDGLRRRQLVCGPDHGPDRLLGQQHRIAELDDLGDDRFRDAEL